MNERRSDSRETGRRAGGDDSRETLEFWKAYRKKSPALSGSLLTKPLFTDQLMPIRPAELLIVIGFSLLNGPALAEDALPSETDCHAARASMSAWQSVWDMLDLALARDGYVQGVPASVISQDPALKASIDDLSNQRQSLAPALHRYDETVKTTMALILKVCGPFK
jgi:hypothetical protein